MIIDKATPSITATIRPITIITVDAFREIFVDFAIVSVLVKPITFILSRASSISLLFTALVFSNSALAFHVDKKLVIAAL